MEVHTTVKMFISIAVVGVLGLIMHLFNSLIMKPERLRSLLRRQGISGPPPTLLLGNIKEIMKARNATPKTLVPAGEAPTHHNCAEAVFPFLGKWQKQYGDVFNFSLGTIQILYVNQPDALKELTTCTSLDLGKPSYQQRERGPLLGKGILTSNGLVWAHQRKALAPELYMDKVKGMTNLITESAITLLNSWKGRIEAEGGVADIKIDQDLKDFAGDVISRACFGSNFSKGEEIFKKLRALEDAASKKMFSAGIPGMRHLPTKDNRTTWALGKEVKRLIQNVVKDRNEAGYENDLLQMLIEGAKNSDLNQDGRDQFVVDNCKNIYLAGFETTALSAVWCLMLLAANPDWQDRVRAEVQEVCGDQIPDYDMILKMKKVTMVVNEGLRLYPPVAIMSREALTDMKFGNIDAPKGVNIWTMAMTLQTDPEIWGPDAYEFNPDRFANGVTGACKFPHLYMPFGIGPRVCLGKNFALLELKIIISLILSNFSFSLSPKYVHAPCIHLVVEPKYGVNLLMKKL